MPLRLTNNATSTLAASISDDDTTLSVQSADAGRFPVLGSGDWHPLTIVDAAGNMEIVRATGRSGATITIERAQEGTSAKVFDSGARVDLRMTAETQDALRDRDNHTGTQSIATVSGLPTALSGLEQGIDEVGNSKLNRDGSNWNGNADARRSFRAAIGLGEIDVLIKADRRAVALDRTGNDTVSIKAGTIVAVDGHIYTYHDPEPVTMPSLSAGDDFAVWIRPDGQPVATLDHTSPPVDDARKIGGGHYAPGGNAPEFDSGGNSTPQINPYSLWDEKFRPACSDPRGMTLVANSFWCDMYLCSVEHDAVGTSRLGAMIASGGRPPKVPIMFGGDGSADYGSMTWWEAAEVMMAHGKQLLSYAEFAAAAFGVVEGAQASSDPGSNQLRADFTSLWGVFLATGNLWVWGRDFGGDYGSTSHTSNTDGRGTTHTLSNVALFGGHWDSSASPGSRASNWNSLPSYSAASGGARGRSDHLSHV